jgi:transposase
MRPLALLLLLAVAGCTEQGYPSTDTEAVMLGIFFCVLTITAGAVVWRMIG